MSQVLVKEFKFLLEFIFARLNHSVLITFQISLIKTFFMISYLCEWRWLSFSEKSAQVLISFETLTYWFRFFWTLQAWAKSFTNWPHFLLFVFLGLETVLVFICLLGLFSLFIRWFLIELLNFFSWLASPYCQLKMSWVFLFFLLLR